MTVHEHRFTEPTPPFDLTEDEIDDLRSRFWRDYEWWLDELEFQTGDAR